jgi:HAD superfamily hydrolase (TIGR01490 family)
MQTSVPASYFDVDWTLVKTNLLHSTLFYLANQANPLQSLRRIGRAVLAAPAMLLTEKLDRRMFNELLFSHFEGMSLDRLDLLADEAFEHTMRKALVPHAVELVQRCLDSGHEVVLVSGALDFLVRQLATHLGAHAVIANRLEIKDNYATGRLLRPVVAGPEKARLIREHAREKGHDLNECYGYSDSYSDVPMLSVVGYPTCVNPDFRLAQLASAYSWAVLRL